MKSPSARQLERWDKQYLWHPFTQQFLWEKSPTLIIDSGRGIYLKDIRGRRYLDSVSSLWVNIHGHNHPALNAALKKQIAQISHSTFLGLSHRPAIELGKELARIAPKGLTRSFYSDSGATAIEIALKMAFQYWLEVSDGRMVRPEFLALKGSYHGDTLGAVSVGGIGAFHSKFKPLLFKSHFAMQPGCAGCPANKTGASSCHRLGEKIKHVPKPGELKKETGCRWECLSDAERILKQNRKRLAAAVVEPVMQGAGGMRVMAPGYVAGLKRLCEKYGVLLIADEVATGFGRTGTLFACEQERVVPDLLCLAKGLTGGYSPLAVTMTAEKIFKAFWAPPEKARTFFHGHSYTGHPLGSAVALASLRLFRDGKLLEKTRQKAQILKDELQTLARLKSVGSIRQAGLMVGVDLVADREKKIRFSPSMRMGARVCTRLLDHGIWSRPLGDTLVIMPPLIISERELRRLVRSIGAAILHECER